MISAAEQHVLGWPLPASLVERTESMRSRVAMFISAGTRGDVCTGKKGTSGNDHYRTYRSLFRVLSGTANPAPVNTEP
jgi:hypothetical protein